MKMHYSDLRHCMQALAHVLGWSEEAREAKRDELRHVLTAAVCARGESDGEVYYYQGMHDIAAVLLFELGERPAFAMLRRLARCQLRDCTRCA